MNRAVDKFLENIEQSVKDQISNMDLEKLYKLGNVLIETQRNNYRFHFTGIGKSSQVATYMSSLYSSIGFPSYYLDATEAIHGSLGQVKKGDVVFLISNSGETEELLRAAHSLKQNGAFLIAINKSATSKLSELSNVYIIAKVEREGDRLNKPPRASVICQIIVLQTLSIILQELSSLDMETYLRWHPGGKIGESLDYKI